MAGFVRSTARIALSNRSTFSKLLNKQIPCTQQVAKISSKAWRELNGVQRPPPYDYQNSSYQLRHSWFDKTTKRFDDNSKIILVEGPIAAGKTEFAKKLANDLDMYYLPQACMDDVYINEYGYDLRDLDVKLPPGAQSFDEKKFVNDPTNRLTAAFQLNMYSLKFSDYIDALAHLFSTGQGVVLERSPYSDIVFVEALYKCNLITKTTYKGLIETRNNSLPEILKPHLVIYLDVPVNTTLEKIKKRNLHNEANSPLFKDTKFLETIDEVYKRNFLKDISSHSELLVYDWSNGGDTELVVEDIERIDFDSYEKESSKMRDWRFFRVEADWCEARMKYTEDRHITFSYANLPLFHCPDLCIQPEDNMVRNRIYEEAKGSKYAYGYDVELGDKDILFKTKHFNSPKSKHWDF
ncbi:NADH dehydrogenase [ubiquinone] 1 alpha subcomplex subunit 10, mitochondrial isoform X2 [Sitodiplosis mosellana]|nr:NADH dehydrogenase [ubiquinone] 1 alpha subcomplex subunit 10, mitochondrial isoform X2 [Sitodiplosis mosellana]XP_055305501.1 NADH dehydrogenase [ubiquinone] 1 alpha subcomplex subunit 10, mitochondrial isoform X2 [Sitodiplosis mosellana]XP_055305502.1 NADH dehydrogenase [ubiquinone] 1 alpha subcomplex subunit 10, mitochondrial isoform X2 [Sitodiplosis mosellana]XP_055305503.1 NADH dehydrogenase [ubiquinone] 1 alpha subcomplex subunit 10, mitochondrial isoform X2 [Sitodiplosis mosellana]